MTASGGSLPAAMPPEPGDAIALWAGIEPTVNRVADVYHDQLQLSGHWHRRSDSELIASLGIGVLRYPLLWELVAPSGLDRAEWRWFDERLGDLRRLGIRPIAGLVHHGSGPRSTSIVDEGFAPALAGFAGACAERYPWIEDYTPINEPLTTARFSTLYGMWYPHARDDGAFARAVVHQCTAVALAMRAIRKVNPRARLIQTEDLGTVSSTPPLAYQAEFENHRRWLTFDLLCGRVDGRHPMWSALRAGVSDRALGFFLDQPCPPDVVGLDYYVLSDRTLDHRLELYPPHTHGGNGRAAYADIETVRAPGGRMAGHEQVLLAAWERYRLPVALTEVHLDCTREEQMRWLDEAWRGAAAARARGADVRAVTLWALLGAFDWSSLLTRFTGYYEPGAFDVRAQVPRPTALATMARSLAERGASSHPALAMPGWWQRGGRDAHAPDASLGGGAVATAGACPTGPPTLAVTGATGTLGQAFARACQVRGLPCRLLSRDDMDIASEASVARALDQLRPWAIINAAGFVRVDDAERDPARCARENVDGAEILARAAAARGLKFLTFSSDLVFAGDKREPYRESDAPGPLSQYGRSKAEAERRVLSAAPDALVVRTSAFFGPWDAHNFLTVAMEKLRRDRPVRLPRDEVVSPTYVPDLVRVSLDLLLDDAEGLWHLCNRGASSFADLAWWVAERMNLPTDLIESCQMEQMPRRAPRPRYSVLTSERAAVMPPLEDALERYMRERHAAAA